MDGVSEQVKDSHPDPDSAPQTARQVIRRAKRYSGRRVSAEDKIRIVMEGVRRQRL